MRVDDGAGGTLLRVDMTRTPVFYSCSDSAIPLTVTRNTIAGCTEQTMGYVRYISLSIVSSRSPFQASSEVIFHGAGDGSRLVNVSPVRW